MANSKSRTKVTLKGTQETLLVTLYSRYHDTEKSGRPILADPWAKHIMKQLDYDFSYIEISRTLCAALPARSLALDDWVAPFLDAHGEKKGAVTVVHIACGLDTRALRLLNGPGDDVYGNGRGCGAGQHDMVRWIDIDVPDVVELRQKLLPAPAADKVDYSLMGVDVTSESEQWLDRIPNDRPTLILFEGLSMYLTEEQGQRLLARLVDRFGRQSGSQVIFDGISSLMARVRTLFAPIHSTGATFGWCIDDPHALELALPGLYLEKDQLSCDVATMANFSWPTLAISYTIRWIPMLRNIHRIVEFRLNSS